MAITKQRKDEVIQEYSKWLSHSQAIYLTEYTGLSMKSLDELRNKVREAGGEFHVIKNTLGRIAFKQAGLPLPESFLQGSTAAAFAFQDPPTLAKILTDFAKTSEFVKVKGGYLEQRVISAEDVKALADMPPLPVMRAQVMGTILAPASQLVRTLAEPARALAAVIKAFAERETAPAA